MGAVLLRMLNIRRLLVPGCRDLKPTFRCKRIIQSELKDAGWSAEIQQAQMMGHPISNIIGEGKPWIILGAHYATSG